MTVAIKGRGDYVFGSVHILNDLTVDGAISMVGGITILGDFTIGESADGSDLKAWGDTAGYYMLWDANADTNGGLIVIGTTALTGNLTVDGTLVSIDGATSVRGISAGFTSLESPANRFGSDAAVYMSVATTATTGITAITHTGSAPAVTWTADSLSFVGNFDSNGATAQLDGSTSVKLVSAAFVGVEAPDIRLGVSASVYMDIAVTATTGVTAITHTGTGATVTWTVPTLGLVANTAVTGTLGVSGTLSAGLDATAGTIELYPGTTNTGTTTITMADNAGDTITNVNVAEQAGARTYTIPDAGADASFLMTDSYKTWWPFAVGLAGEDTDGAATNGAGIAGGVVDLTTHTYNDGAYGTGDVLCLVYDHGTTTWEDFKASSSLGDWTADYQFQPDAASEEAGDAFAIGMATQFCEIAFTDLSTGAGAVATYSNDAGKWQYSTGAGTWSDLTVFDNTDLTAQDGLRTLQRIGALSFAPPSDWVSATYDTDKTGYWIQWVCTAAEITACGVAGAVDVPCAVIPNADAFDTPFKATIGEVRATDMGVTVHDQIVKFVVGNFTTGIFSQEFSWTASQYNDTFTPTTPLAVSVDDIVGICITEDTSSTVNPIVQIELEATYLN